MAGPAESEAKMETQTDEPGCLETLLSLNSEVECGAAARGAHAAGVRYHSYSDFRLNTPTGPRPVADAPIPDDGD
jgi:hypothetical protein